MILVMGIAAILFVAGCSMLSGDNQEAEPAGPEIQTVSGVIGEGNVIPNEHRYLGFMSSGRVAEILVEKGDQVTEGQVLARLDDREQAEAALAAATLELESAQQEYDDLHENAEAAREEMRQAWIEAREMLMAAEFEWDDYYDTDDYQDDLDDADEEVADRQDDLDDAQEDFDRYKDLDEDNPTRERYEDDLDDAMRDYNEAVRDRDQLVLDKEKVESDILLYTALVATRRADYEAALTGPDPDKLQLAEKRIANAEAQIISAEKALADLELIAPFAGTIVEIDIVTNEVVTPNDRAMLIADFSEMFVETNDLTELEVVKVFVGQQVSIYPDALPDVEIMGTVVEISDVYRSQSGDILYDVKIDLANIDSRLRWGMTVEVIFSEE